MKTYSWLLLSDYCKFNCSNRKNLNNRNCASNNCVHFSNNSLVSQPSLTCFPVNKPYIKNMDIKLLRFCNLVIIWPQYNGIFHMAATDGVLWSINCLFYHSFRCVRNSSCLFFVQGCRLLLLMSTICISCRCVAGLVPTALFASSSGLS